MTQRSILEQFLKAASDRESAVERLAIKGLHTDGAHHKQWYLEQILDYVASRKTRDMMICADWEPGIPD